MFEKILEKVLLNYFGRFIDGLNKNNLKLGVWSGNVVIENVNLKPEVIELLELPFKLKQSQIGKMHFKIPWKNLSSAPLEILIDNVYLTVIPLPPEEWNFSDQVIIDKKFQLLMEYCKECMKKSLNKKKKSNDSDDPSYLDKLAIKILDNIQLKITNIHFRWEMEGSSNVEDKSNIYKYPHSWGLTLQSLEIITTDELWRKQYIDRTDQANKFTPMNRLFQLTNLAVYWNSMELEIYKQPQNYTTFMDQRIYLDNGKVASQKSQFIISINSEVRVIQNPGLKVYLPLYQYDVQLQWLDLSVRRNQFKQLLNLLESFSIYTNLLWVQRKKAREVSESAITEYQNCFLEIFPKVYLSENKTIDILNEADLLLFKTILRSMGYEVLIQWVKKVAKILIKENKVTEITNQKTKKDSSWWKAAKQKDKTQEELTDNEIQEIEQQIEKLFEEQEVSSQYIARPKDSIDQTFEFMLKGGSIQVISDLKGENNQRQTRIQEEGLKLIYSDMYCKIEFINDGRLELLFRLKNLELMLVTKYQGEESIYTPFCYKSHQAQNSDQFFNLLFQKHVDSKDQKQLEQQELQKEKQSGGLNASLGLQIQPIECIYNPAFVKRFKDFFQTQDVDESLKSATWDKIESIQDSTQSKIDYILNTDAKITVQLDIFSPIVIIPFNFNNDMKCECWIINFGNLKMASQQSRENIYDSYSLNLENMSFRYFPSREFYYQWIQTKEPFSNQIFSILSADTLTFDLNRLKQSIKSFIDKDKSAITINGDLPPISLQLTPYLHDRLLEIEDLLFPEQSDFEQIEILQNEKNSLLKNLVIQGNLKKKDKTINYWTPYYAMCSGVYIYLFKDCKDLNPELNVYIKKAEITKLKDYLDDDHYVFQLVNRNEKFLFECENSKELETWFDILSKHIDLLSPKNDEAIIVEQIEQLDSVVLQPSEIKQEKSQGNINYLQINLKIQEIKVILQESNEQANQIYCLQIENFTYFQQVEINRIHYVYTVQDLLMIDFLHKYKNSEYQHFISSYDPQQLRKQKNLDSQFLKITRQWLRLDALKDDWVAENIFEVDELYLNWKPDVWIKIIQLFHLVKSRNLKDLQEDEAQMKLQGMSDEQIQQIQLEKLIKQESRKPKGIIKAEKKQINSLLINREYLMSNLALAIDLFVSDKNKKLNDEYFQQNLQILTNSKFIIKRAKINLLHQQTHICLGFIETENITHNIQQTQFAQFTSGCIQNAELFDLTGYPQTISCEEKGIMQNPPRLLYKDSQANIVRYYLTFYDRQYLKGRQNSFLRFEVSPITFHYQHQPFMRLLNYIQVQMITLISCPEYLTLNQEFIQASETATIVRNEILKKKPKLVIGTTEQIFNTFIDPTFLSFEVQVDKSVIVLARTLDDKNRIEVSFDGLFYTNEQIQDQQRMALPQQNIDLPIWCDLAHIHADQLRISIVSKDQIKQISNLSAYSMDWSRLLHFHEYMELFPKLNLRSSYDIKSFITSLNLELTYQDYLYLCAMFMHNFTFDDFQDKLFIHDYEVYKEFAPTEIRFLLYLPQISLLMKDRYDVLFSNILLRGVQAEYMMNTTLDRCIKFYCKQVEFNEFVQKQAFIKQVIIGNLGQTETFKDYYEVHSNHINDQNNQNQIDELNEIKKNLEFKTQFGQKQERKTSIQVQKELQDKQQYELLMDFIFERNSPTREIVIGLNTVRISAKTRRIFQLLEWITLTDECYPKSNNKVEMGLAVMVDIRNGFLCFPSYDKASENLITAKGNINYIFDKQPLQDKVQNQHKITLSKLEFFICEFKDLLNKQLNKRQIILPLHLYFGIKDQFDRNYLQRTIDCTFDKTSVKLSNSDLRSVFSAINYQRNQVGEELKVECQNDTPTDVDYYMLSSSIIPLQYEKMTIFNCVIYGIQIVIISGQESPAPQFDLFLNEWQFSYTSKKDHYLINVQTQVQSSNYNNTVGVWEPIIEPMFFQIDHFYNQNGNPKSYLTIEINSGKFSHVPFNINLSAPIMLKLKDLIDIWQESVTDLMEDHQDMLATAIRPQTHSQDYESIQNVSPYLLKNKTGHTIEATAITRIYEQINAQQGNIFEPLKFKIRNEQVESIRYTTSHDSIFQQSSSNMIERKKLSLRFLSDSFEFSELSNIDFDKVYSKKLQIQMKLNQAMKKINVVLDLKAIGNYKQLTLSSDIQINNYSQRPIEILFNMKYNEKLNLMIKIQKDKKYYVPIGYDQSIIQFRFYKEGQNPQQNWSSFIDLARVQQQQNDATFDLCPKEAQSLILFIKRTNVQSHFLQLYLQCPFAIHNRLPVTVQYKVSGINLKYECKGFESIKLAEVQPTQDFKVQVKLPGFQFSQVIPLMVKVPNGQQFIVRDYLGIEIKLRFAYIGQEEGFYTFILQSDMIIKNILGKQVFFYGRCLKQNEKEKKQFSVVKQGELHPQMNYLAGQPIPGITDEEDKLYRCGGTVQVGNEFEIMQLSFEQGGETQSKPEQFQRQCYSPQFPVKEGIGRYLVRIPLSAGYMDVVAETKNIVIDEKLQLIAPQLTLQPKCVIVNQFNCDIVVRQYGVKDQELKVKQGERLPLHWFTYFSKYIQFFYKNNTAQLCKTGYISLDVSGTLTCPTRRIDDCSIDTSVLVSSYEVEKIQYIKIEPTNTNTRPLYKVQNLLQNIAIQFYQSCYEEIHINLKTVVGSNQEQSYAFDHPTHPKELNVELIGPNNQYIGMITVNLTHANWHQSYKIEVSNSKFKIIYIKSRFSIQHKQILVTVQENDIKQDNFDHSSLSDLLIAQIQITVPSLTVSLISTPTIKERRKELLVLQLQKIEVVVLSDNYLQTTQLRVSSFQLDNNRLNRCHFPVSITARNREDIQKAQIPIFNMIITRAHQVNFVNYFKSVKMILQPLVIKVTEGTLEDLYQFYLQLTQEKEEEINTDLLIKTLNESQKELTLDIFPWKLQELSVKQLCFIEQIEIYPLHFLLSFIMQEAQGNDLKRLIKPPPGQQFLSCDEASIKLHGIMAENVQQTPQQFLSRVGQNYQDDFQSNLIKIIGSMDVLGNPMGLIRNVGEGFQDLYEMPKEGFIKGPIEGGIGIAKGVGSLTKGVVSGTFNTVQKITGSLAQGFSAISMDDEYLRERSESSAKKPKHVVDGIGQGMISLFSGVGEGITGLFTQPVQGAQKDGVEGLLKGTFKGLAGLIVKPVVGVMDLTSKTAEGIKNTTNLFDDNKPNEKRYRPPRIFYSREQYYRNYKLSDAEVIMLLQKLNQQLFKEQVELLECISHETKQKLYVYVITLNSFILVSITDKSIKFIIPTKGISGLARASENELHIHLYKPLKDCEDSKTAGVKYIQNQNLLKIVSQPELITTLHERLNHLVQVVYEL